MYLDELDLGHLLSEKCDHVRIMPDKEENSKANLSMARKKVKVIFGAQIYQNTSANFDKTASKGDSLKL